MALTIPPVCNFGWKAESFCLPATDSSELSLDEVSGSNGTLLMFICNHCPYVVSAIDRIVSDAKELQEAGIGVAAICANDAVSYPQDSFDRMKAFAVRHRFSFPYLHDEDQTVARSYDAQCTPDFFGFNSSLELQYRGRLDSAGANPPNASTVRELRNAMLAISRTGVGPSKQTASMGCSIKWK